MVSDPLRLLLVDDDQRFRSSLLVNLRLVEHATTEATSAEEALAVLEQSSFDAVLCDVGLPGKNGIELLREIKRRFANLPVIIITGLGTAELAIDAVRHGAFYYIQKPFEFDELQNLLRRVAEQKRLLVENETLRSSLGELSTCGRLIARSDAMREVFSTVQQLAPFSTTVLICGESGTGKELLARAIHETSPRKDRAFVAVNCAAIPEHLLEAELFGHKRGAFTDATKDRRGLFEEANGGTLFLDEIGEMPLHLQVKLLRVLQEQKIRRVGDEEESPVDVRIIAATLRDLEEDVIQGRFREDLFYRINVVTLFLPALRDRPEDIPLLIEHLRDKFNRRFGLSITSVSPTALEALLAYPWPGNVRELENAMERSMVLARGNEVAIEQLPDPIRRHDARSTAPASPLQGLDDKNLSLRFHTARLEKAVIERALKVTGGNRTKAAKLLEISHRALLYKLKEYGIARRGKGDA